MFVITKFLYVIDAIGPKIYFTNKPAALSVAKDITGGIVNKEHIHIKAYDTKEEYIQDNKSLFEQALEKLTQQEYEAIVEKINENNTHL